MKLSRNTFQLIFSTVAIFALTLGSFQSQNSYSQNEDLSIQQVSSVDKNITKSNDKSKYAVNDSEMILLAGKTIPSGSYLYLYDSTPYKISNVHILAKIPCNEEYSTPIVFLFGPDREIPISGLDLISELSDAGDLCSYQGSVITNGTNNITDIAIFNNSPDDIDFPDSSSLVIKVNEIATPGYKNTDLKNSSKITEQ